MKKKSTLVKFVEGVFFLALLATMASEESIHLKFLSEQFPSFEKTKEFTCPNLQVQTAESIANIVLSEDIKNRIAAAGFIKTQE